MSYHQTRQAQSEKTFQTLYTACSGLSVFHDLRCGHRVQSTNLSESCGVTCKKAATNAPFVCPDCVVADVRLEMLFESIDLCVNGDDAEMLDEGPTREQQIRAIADAEIKKRLAQGYRMCKVTPKFEDPRMQFFQQFMEEEGFGGIDGNSVTDTASNEPLKRPMQTDRARANDRHDAWQPREPRAAAKKQDIEDDPAMTFTVEDIERDWKELQARFETKTGLEAPTLDALSEEMGHSHIEQQQEDDAMAAVRQALEACVIGAATATMT